MATATSSQTKPRQLVVAPSTTNQNPFFGMKHTLALFQAGGKGTVTDYTLSTAYAECKTKEQRELFFTLLFSFFDITNRSHNLFRKTKVDNGGTANREVGYVIVDWMKRLHYKQFKNFLFRHLFNEYSSFDLLLANRVKTSGRKKPTVARLFNSLAGSEEYKNDLADFVATIIKGANPINKYFVAKFLTRPRMSKRTGHKKMLSQTKGIMNSRQEFLKLVSDKAGLLYTQKTGYIDFFGYYTWRKEFNGELESVLFSTGAIKDFDEIQFKEFLEKTPSGARYRIRRRLLTEDDKPKSDKWGNLAKWMLSWEKFKETKQTEVRVVEEKIKQGTATEDEKEGLKQLKKEAKVTTGATNFIEMHGDIVKGTVDKLKIQPFLDAINLNFNSLVFIDDSGSMAQRWGSGQSFSAFDMACFIATIMLTKNPDDEGRGLLGFYSNRATLYSLMEGKATRQNSILNASNKAVREPLIKPELHFLDNLKRIRSFAESVRTSNGTDIESIPRYIASQTQDKPELLESLMNFPVWVIISDGNWNNMPSPEASINSMMRYAENTLGFKPFIIAIDVANSSSSNVERFSGIENFMFIPPNPAQIEQFLTNFKDMDVMDVYQPLLSMYRSNRYDAVRAAVL
jgi:hypothetical protein